MRAPLLALTAAVLPLVVAASAASASRATPASSSTHDPPIVQKERTYTYIARGLLSPPSQVRHVIAWGDGSTTTITLEPTQERQILHTYPRPGAYEIVDTVTYLFNQQTYQVHFNLEIGNNPPISRNDTWLVQPGETFEANVLANDSDPDGDEITAVNWKPRSPGAKRVSVKPSGALAFNVPRGAESGTTWLVTYQARDPWPRAPAGLNGSATSHAVSRLARVTLKTTKCWGTASEPLKKGKRVTSRFTFDCAKGKAGTFELEQKIYEKDEPAQRDEEAAEAEYEFVTIDDQGQYTDASGRTKFQYSFLLEGTCLEDGPGKKSEFFSRLRYRFKGGSGGANDEESTWRTVKSSTASYRCRK